MKGFGIDARGDVVIVGKDIQMVSGEELLKQKILQILSTNQGEWWLDKKEGIPIHGILKKNPDQQLIQGYVRKALRQVDESLELEMCSFETRGRELQISFLVRAGNKSTRIDMEV